MNVETQRRFMYLFERITEPLYLGPKGTGSTMTFFNIPMSNLSQAEQNAAKQIRDDFRNSFPSLGPFVPIAQPSQPPNLTRFGQTCPKSAIFSYFLPSHRGALHELTDLFMGQRSVDDLLNMACVCRDSQNMNPSLFVYALATAVIQRRDMRGFKLPPIYEILPDLFLGSAFIKAAEKQSALPEKSRGMILVPESTGFSTNPENKLAYFREDMGMNSHHWHWHLIYTDDAPRSGPNSRNRKGELFYYMHHSMIARYEAERLSNGLPRTKTLNFDDPIVEGYFSKLTTASSGRNWGSRQQNTKLSDVDRSNDTEAMAFVIAIQDMKKWRDRVLTAIETKSYYNERFVLTTLPDDTGIDILGDMIENSMLSPNQVTYGSFGFHNWGHVLIAFSHDPLFKHREASGVMGDPATAMRDPVFYRWHKHIDDIFDTHKMTLPPYELSTGQHPLLFQGIQIESFSVQSMQPDTKGVLLRPNNLITNWMRSDVDLSRGLDFFRTTDNMGSIWARITHLDHDSFEYRITVNNTTSSTVEGTFRIFMAPRFNEQGVQFTLSQQRLLFFEMDKFSSQLAPGSQSIVRKSEDSSVTIPWLQSFRKLEQDLMTPTAAQSICGCGWPQHLLVPRGSSSGMDFDLFLLISNAANDKVRRSGARSQCKEAMSFCGILDELYPDAKPMGYPFDRMTRRGPVDMTNPQGRPIEQIENFMPCNSNGRTVVVKIIHRNIIKIRPDGAPTNITTIDLGDGNTVTEDKTVMETKPVGESAMKPQEPSFPIIKPKPSNGNKVPRPGQRGDNGRQHQYQHNHYPGWRAGRDDGEGDSSHESWDGLDNDSETEEDYYHE